MMQKKIDMKVDTAAIDESIAGYEKQLRQNHAIKAKLIEEMDTMDPSDRHYDRRKSDLDDRLYRMYDKIDAVERDLAEAQTKKAAIVANQMSAKNIFKALIYFDNLYGLMNEVERRQFVEELISEVHIHEARQPNGQWLKAIVFRLPIIEENMEISLDGNSQDGTVVLLSQQRADEHIDIEINFDELDVTSAEAKATYPEIKRYVQEQHGLNVSSLYISQIKRKCGLEMGQNYNLPKSGNPKVPVCPPAKEAAIMDALRHFKMI